MSAEALKLRRHRATWLLVWIFPIGVLIISLVAIAVEMARGGPPASGAPELARWLGNATIFWEAPRSNIGRFLTVAFVATVFAGEYRWNTWKLIVPHRARATLIAAKYLVSLGLLYAAFLAAALIMNALGWLEDVLTGDPIPAGITFANLARAHWLGLVAGLPIVLFTVALASCAAILFRSTTAALIAGIVYVTLEALFVTLAPAISFYLPGITESLFQFLPGYHLANLASWIDAGNARSVLFPPNETIAYGWAPSLAILAAWTITLVALTFWRFGRQDIN